LAGLLRAESGRRCPVREWLGQAPEMLLGLRGRV
jgi:hypothetical protein